MAEHPRVCSRGRCARSWAGAHVLCTCSATAPSEVGEPWRSVTPAGDTGTAPPRSTTRVRRAPSLVQGARGVRARAPSVHRAYSTQQSSVVMHTHVHTHTHICCARRGACTRRLCTHTHAQGSARALVPPVAVHTDTHVPHAQSRAERATHTCRACAHQHTHAYMCETCLHTQSLYSRYQHSRAPCTHARDPLTLAEPLHTCTHFPHAHRHPLAHTDPAHCGAHVHTQSSAHQHFGLHVTVRAGRNVCVQSRAHQHTRAQRACAHRHTRTHTELCTHTCIQCSEQQQVYACPVPCTPIDVHTEPHIQHAHTCTVPRTPAHTCARRAVPTGTHAQGCAQCSLPSPWPPQPYSLLWGARPGHAAQRLATSCGWWYMNIPASVSPMPR